VLNLCKNARMVYIPHKNISGPSRSGARPGKRSARPTFGVPSKPFTRGAYSPVKKARWVPRTGTGATPKSFARPSLGTPRQVGEVRTPSPFPQKPPYRPNGPVAPRAPFIKRPVRVLDAKGPARALAGGHYGFLPKDEKKGVFVKKPYASKNTKPWEKSKPPFRPSTRPISPKTQLAKYAPKQATTSWGTVATWYDKHLENPDTYHEKVILPNLLRLVDPQKGDHILDLATGQGFIARAFAEKGASVIGLDISLELIALAKKKGGANVTYHVGSADDLSLFTDEKFNKAIVVLAIQNIEHVRAVLAEASRVLEDGGTLHLVMNHPTFRVPKRSGWGYDEKEKVQFRRVDQYLSESREDIDMHPGMKDSPQTVSFHRSLQYYMKALFKAGFVIDRFEEWISHKDSDSGPRAKAENLARKEIPLFLYMRAKKNNAG